MLLYNGGTICAGSTFDRNAADAICKAMGYSGSDDWTSGYYWEEQETYQITLDEVQCNSVVSWKSCNYSTSPDCRQDDQDVFLDCTSGQYQYFKYGHTSL